jgi:uncharacterized repeat protein (TIGR03943 family)
VSVENPLGNNSFVLTRFLMSCCAADARPLNVTLVGAAQTPPSEQWIEVTARYEPDLTAAHDTRYGPVLQVKHIKPVDAPASPYESLR